MTQRRASKEVRMLARRAAALTAEANMDGLDAALAVMAAAIYVSFDAAMTRRDIADWFRRLAAEFDGEEERCGRRRAAPPGCHGATSA
jgi:hypothetical protein